MKNQKSTHSRSFAALTAIAVGVVSGSSAFAASGTWNGSADATWANGSNWTTVTPGATSGTTNGDTAIFNAANPSFGTGTNPVIVDSGRNLENITFDTNAGPYVIGTTGGNALTLTAAGTLQNAATLSSGNTETVNAPIILEGNYTFANNSTTLGSALQVGGSVTGAASTAVTLTLGGINANTTNVLSGTIAPGATGGTIALTKTGAGYWDVTGNNTGYTGTTTISAGTLSIGNANALGAGLIVLGGGSLAADTSLSLSNSIYQSTPGTPGYVSGPNSIATTGSLTFNGTTGNPSLFVNNMTGGATFSVTGPLILANNGSTIGDVRFTGPGNTSILDIYGGPIGNSSISSNLSYYGTGTFTLNGTDNRGGGTDNLLGGTVVLNYGAGSDVGQRLQSTGNLFLGSNLILSGGSGNVETVASTSVAQNSGATYYASISASPGSGNTINLGTLNGATNGSINFQPGVATTTSSTGTVGAYGSGGTGVFGGWATVGNGSTEDFATVLTATAGTPTTIVGLPTYLYSLENSTLGGQGLDLTPNASGTNFSNTGQGNYGVWKIDTSNGTASGTFTMSRSTAAANFFGTENILYTGGANYTITGNPMYQNESSAGGTSTGQIYLNSYGTGTLTINSAIYGGIYITSFSGGTFGGVYGGNGALLKTGPGTVVLAGTNNYVGITSIAEGTLSISSDSNLGGVSGTLVVTSASTGSKTVTVTGVPTSETLVGATFLGSTITGQSAPSGSTYTLTLAANANTSTAGTYAYANGTQALGINGTLQATSSFTLGETASASTGTVTNYRPITISVDGATINVTGSNTLTAPGVISAESGTGVTGDVTFTKTGSGTLILSGADTYTGGTFVNGGTLELSFNTANGAPPTSNILASTGAVSLGGATLNVNDAATAVANSQTIASLSLTGGSNTVSMTHNSATSSSLVVSNGSIARAAGSTVDFVAPASTSIVLGGNTNNPFLGTYAFFGTGSSETYAATSSTGVVQAATLNSATGVNSFTSATANYAYTSPGTPDVLAGNATANSAVFNTTSAQTIDLGTSGANTLTLNGLINDGGVLTIQRTGGTGSLVIGSANELILGGASNVNISAPITGSGALTDSNTGVVTLSGANTYTGTTTVNSGTLTMSGGSLTGSNVVTSASGAGVFNQTGGVIAGATTTFTQASTGTSTLTGLNTFGGLTTVSNGELDLNAAGQALAGNLTVSGGTAKLLAGSEINTASSLSVSGGTFNLQTFNQTLAGVQLTGGMLLGTTGTLTSLSTYDFQGGTDSAILAGAVGLTKTTGGTSLITSANTYTGATTISAGDLFASSIVVASNASNLGNATSAVVLGGTATTGTLSYTGLAATFTRGFTINSGGGEIDSGGGLLTIGTGGIGDSSGGLLTLGGVGSTTVNSVIGGGSGGLTVSLDGTLTLAGLNTYTGPTTINAGVLSVSNIVVSAGASNLGNATSAVTIADGADLSYTGNSAVFTRGFNIGVVGGEIDTTTAGQTLTIATGNISNTGNGLTTFGGVGNTTVSSSIGSGTGGVTKTGTGTLTLASSDTYSGATTVSAGQLTVANTSGSATGSGALTVGANATLAGSGITSGTTFSISGTGTTTATQAKALVGQTSTSDTNTSSYLSLNGSGTSTIANANLVFNLNALAGSGTPTNGTGLGASGSGNSLSVGSSKVSFGTTTGSVQFSLNIQNQAANLTIPGDTFYVLVAGSGTTTDSSPLAAGGTSSGQYLGLTFAGASTTVGSGTLTPISLTNFNLTFTQAFDASVYGPNSQLVLYESGGVDDIGVVVVPEPGTWALMFSGFALLIFYQYRRNKSNRLP